ncbi:hypothetical protein AU210_007941 [Fusarium oxysporum f. sp. radicis-cucumerinum]|uniref:Uncharacterized protein n=1 Tax=Fusarium oxysporum f. sp. radicis-cucumerinum TaxID=327505 RepID=A0A2H3GXN0_FUSOX|nr:hypothetical protein AU210_007941 [Fusarium oxysporum f. sp. radicis-cucumerinum]
MDRIFRPAKPSSPQLDEVGAKPDFGARIWSNSQSLRKYSKTKDRECPWETSKEKRAKAIAEDESKRGESCKKGEPAYLTVTVVKGSALRFQWKDAKRPIGSIDKVTFEPGWDVDRAEFEAKLAYDSYWSYEMGQYNRRLVVYTGCLILRTSAQAKASGPPLAHSSGLSLQGPMEKPLIREIDEATASKIRRHQKMFAERMGASRAGQSH